MLIDRSSGFALRELLRAAFERPVLCGLSEGVLAVIVLDAPSVVEHDELLLAMRIHAALERGVLIVF
jgi:hypothetical protein